MGGEDRGVSANFKVERTTWRNRYDPHNRNNRQSLPRPPRILPKTIKLVAAGLLAAGETALDDFIGPGTFLNAPKTLRFRRNSGYQLVGDRRGHLHRIADS